MEKQIYKNAFLNVVVCPCCKQDLLGPIQRDSKGQPFFTAFCECGEVVVSCFDLVFKD